MCQCGLSASRAAYNANPFSLTDTQVKILQYRILPVIADTDIFQRNLLQAVHLLHGKLFLRKKLFQPFPIDLTLLHNNVQICQITDRLSQIRGIGVNSEDCTYRTFPLHNKKHSHYDRRHRHQINNQPRQGLRQRFPQLQTDIPLPKGIDLFPVFPRKKFHPAEQPDSRDSFIELRCRLYQLRIALSLLARILTQFYIDIPVGEEIDQTDRHNHYADRHAVLENERKRNDKCQPIQNQHRSRDQTALRVLRRIIDQTVDDITALLSTPELVRIFRNSTKHSSPQDCLPVIDHLEPLIVLIPVEQEVKQNRCYNRHCQSKLFRSGIRYAVNPLTNQIRH